MIITEASAKAARDAIAFAEPEANELRMMRLNSIAQAVSTGDSIVANALIRYYTFASDLLKIEDGKPTLSDPASFEEAFADAKRAHIDGERQDIINDFPTILSLSLKKNPNSQITQNIYFLEKQIYSN